MVGDRAGAGVGRDHRGAAVGDRLQHRRLRGVRDIDHDADAVHLGDRLPAEFAEATVLWRGGCVRVAELRVAVVRQAHVAGAAAVELGDARQVEAHRVAVLDADAGDQLAVGVQTLDRVGTGGEADDVAVLLRHAVDGVELRGRLGVGAPVGAVVQLPLVDVDDEERAVVAALAHLDEVDLRAATHRRVEPGAELVACLRVRRQFVRRQLRVDVLVGVQGQHPRMDRIGLPRGSRSLLGGDGTGDADEHSGDTEHEHAEQE